MNDVPGNGKGEAAQTRARVSDRIEIPPEKAKIILLIGVILAHAVISWFTIVPGHVSVDEAVYLWSTRDLAAGGGFDVWTGYREFPSLELTHLFLRVYDHRPVSQYPYLYPVISLPFYEIAGYSGLFVWNVLSFVLLLGVCYVMTRKLFGDVNLALDSCLILVFATFIWEYSQAAWPHLTAVFLMTATFCLAVYSLYAERRSRALVFAFLAGLVGGFAVGIRIDAFLALPAIILPFVFARPPRPLEVLAIGVGSVPGLGILAATNRIKFGELTPFSYGEEFTGIAQSIPVELATGALAAAAVVWILSRKPVLAAIGTSGGRKIALVCGVLAVAGAVAALELSPRVADAVERVTGSAYEAFIDLRAWDRTVPLAAMKRSAGGGVVYSSGLKKSLLQSLPYLVLVVVPLIGIIGSRREYPQLLMLFLIPVIVGGFYSYTVYEHGGMCLNYRFFLPMLPFTSILCAFALRDLHERWGGFPFGFFWVFLIAALTAGCRFLLTEELFATLDASEFPVLVVPLIMAAVLSLLLALGHLGGGGGINIIRGTAWAVIVAAFTWAGVTAFFYDYPRHRNSRIINASWGQTLLELIPPDSLVITAPMVDPVLGLIQGDRIRVGIPVMDKFKDFPKLIDFYVKSGRRVYAVFPRALWAQLKKGPLEDYRIVPVWQAADKLVAEIVEKPKGRTDEGGSAQ